MLTMKLACLRCKRKKIKCDKAAPVCHQCVTASTECIYAERRKRPRLAQKHDVGDLSRRLESLEQQIHITEGVTPISAHAREISVGTASDSQTTNSPSATVAREKGKESWIYRLASDTRQRFEEVNTHNHSAPVDTPESSNVDDAIIGLKEALSDLEKVRLQPDEGAPKAPDLVLSPEESKKCVKVFREMIKTLIIPDLLPEMLISSLDLELIEVLPDLLNSPYVEVDPAMRVVYYNALFFGFHRLRGPGNEFSKLAYFKVLEAVPEWLTKATGTELDALCAAVTSWTAINNFDYQLSWKFHGRACHFMKSKGIDRLDVLPSRSNEEEERRQSLRYLYWFVQPTDLLFRIFYGKPASLRWKLGRVSPPSLFTTKSMNPSAAQTTVFVISVRYTIMTARIFDVLDECPDKPYGSDVLRQVDEYCSQLEDLVADWNLMSLMKSTTPTPLSWLYGDHLMIAYASIVGIRRLTRNPHSSVPLVDATTLRAARMVISIILHFNPTGPSATKPAPDENYFLFFHFITLYPFCAVFSLYEHVLACSEPDDCEEDVKALESVGEVMSRACEANADFGPLANIVKALNKVSRAMQEVKRNKRAQTLMATRTTQSSWVQATAMGQVGMSTISPSTEEMASPAQRTQQVTGYPPTSIITQQPEGSNISFAAPVNRTPFTSNTITAFPSPATSHLAPTYQPSLPFSPQTPLTELPQQSLDYVRALESDFMGRNWHEAWWEWDFDLGLDGSGGTGAGIVGGDGGGSGMEGVEHVGTLPGEGTTRE